MKFGIGGGWSLFLGRVVYCSLTGGDLGLVGYARGFCGGWADFLKIDEHG
jgi:hypothetical protein